MEQVQMTLLALFLGMGLGILIAWEYAGDYIIQTFKMENRKAQQRKKNLEKKYNYDFQKRMNEIEKSFDSL